MRWLVYLVAYGAVLEYVVNAFGPSIGVVLAAIGFAGMFVGLELMQRQVRQEQPKAGYRWEND